MKNEIIQVDKQTGEIYVAKETMAIIKNLEIEKKKIDEEYKNTRQHF